MTTKANSHTYRKRVKKLTETFKDLNPKLRRIPAPLPRVDSEANRVSPKLAAKDVTSRKEAFGKADEKRLDKESVRYWLDTTIDDTPRRRSS